VVTVIDFFSESGTDGSGVAVLVVVLLLLF